PEEMTQQPQEADVEVTQHQDWEVRCPKSDASLPCEMTQLVQNPDNDQPIMRVVMGYPAETNGKPAMILLLPLGVRLDAGVKLAVDGHQVDHFPFQVCFEQGCQTAFQLEDSVLNRMKNGNKATVSVVDPSGDPLTLDISLLGFTASNEQIAP